MLLDNGSRSLTPSPTTNKRRKSSTRNSPQNKVDISGKKRVVARKKGRDLHKAREIFLEQSGLHDTHACRNGVKLAASSLVQHVKVEDENELAEMPDVNPESQAWKNTGTHDLNQPVVIKHEVVDEGISAPLYLVPNHQTPPNLVHKKQQMCPSQKRVSNARDFSAGSVNKMARLGGTVSNTQKATKLNNANKVGQEIGAANAFTDKIQGAIYGKCRDGLEDPFQSRENACAPAIKQAPVLKKTSETRGQEEKFEDNNAQLGKERKVSKNNVKEAKFSGKGKNEKKKSIGVSSSNTKLVEKSVAGVENERIARSNDVRNKNECSLDKIDVRRKVRDTLRLFHGVLRKLVQATEKEKQGRVDASLQLIAAAKILKDNGRYINTRKIVGPVPGVEVGDIFNYRVELAIIGLHRQVQSGIDFIIVDGKMFANSIVASGRYDNIMNNSDVLIYSGQGGNVDSGCKQLEDQKLERGNLALKNSIDSKNKVRVIRGFKERKQINWKRTTTPTYIYDWLYTVERYWPDLGPKGKWSFKFELKRAPHQPELTWKKVQLSKSTRAREGRHVDDISKGKEKNPICAVNTIDDEESPSFTYITEVKYPDWCRPLPSEGCDCEGGCSDSKLCACARKNGGAIPYNYSGTLVEEKSLVYECGPSCKCPPTCHNRVSQHGIKLPFEIFKTESKGWGLRCLSPIPIGSFVCEYVGELIDDNEAEQRIDKDGYLFDIGQNYNDSTLRDGLSSLIPNMTSRASEFVDNVGFTLDARVYANVGRFINHSCSPNLLAQNILYDFEDKRIPHIMFFAAENIPPLQELTYHYNYTIGQVVDSKGNVKEKSCYCGSADCVGRMY